MRHINTEKEKERESERGKKSERDVEVLKGKIYGQSKSERKRRRKVLCDSKIVASKEASHVLQNE